MALSPSITQCSQRARFNPTRSPWQVRGPLPGGWNEEGTQGFPGPRALGRDDFVIFFFNENPTDHVSKIMLL